MKDKGKYIFMDEPVFVSPGRFGKLVWYSFLLCFLMTGVIQLLHFEMNPSAFWEWAKGSLGLYLCSTLILMVFYHLFFGITGSFVIAGFITVIASFILGYVNYLLHYYRDEPFYPKELAMAANLSSLANMISPLSVVLLILLLVILGVSGYLLYKSLPKTPLSLPWRLGVVGVSAVLVLGICTAGRPGNPTKAVFNFFGADFTGRATFSDYDKNGYLPMFFSQLAAPLMDKPGDYSEDAVMEVVSRYRTAAQEYNTGLQGDGKQPHVVFIMSEAFSDPTRFDQLSFSQDPFPEIRGMMKDFPSGLALTPSFGGGTAHCEFEALSGFSIALTQGASPYENAIKNKEFFPSLASLLQEQGYRTVALHPYHSGMYARPQAYGAMGFSQFVDRDTMMYTDKLENSEYISDEAAYREVLDILGQDESPAFVHLVTMQNHGSYGDSRYDNTISVAGFEKASVTQSMETYAQGLAYTDDATADFFEELSEMEDTIVVFWGDHLPIGYPNAFMKGYAREQYETPLFIGANFPLENEDYGTISPMFFPLLVAQNAGWEQTPFLALLDVLEKEIKGIHMEFLVDVNDQIISYDGVSTQAQDLLHDLELIQYDVLLGEGYSREAGFFRPMP